MTASRKINKLKRRVARKWQGGWRRMHALTRRAGWAATTNDRKLLRLRDKHKGQRCFLIGMGPSLKVDDLERLKSEVTFACNKIYLAFDETDWRPTYYTVVDVLVAQNNRQEIEQLHLAMILPDQFRGEFQNLNNVVYYRGYRPLQYDQGDSLGFKHDILDGIYTHGYTVLLDQLQLAYYMGFTEAYLIGLDFDFKLSERTGEECVHGEVLESGGEVNHFHKDYRKKGETWTMPRLDNQRKSFAYARQAFERKGRCLANASRATKLDVLPRVSFDDLLSDSA